MIPVARIRQTLRYAGKLIGCTDTCLAMLGNAQALNGLHLTEQIVRDVSGEKSPDPKSPGLNQVQLVKAASALHFEYINRTGSSWRTMTAAVDSRRLVVASLWYSLIGGTPIGHAVLVTGRNTDGNFIVIDPMTGTARTVTPHNLHKAMAEFARRGGLSGDRLYFGTSRRVPEVK